MEKVNPKNTIQVLFPFNSAQGPGYTLIRAEGAGRRKQIVYRQSFLLSKDEQGQLAAGLSLTDIFIRGLREVIEKDL